MELNECLKRVWWDLIHRHRSHAVHEDEVGRKRVRELIDALELEYPGIADWYDDSV